MLQKCCLCLVTDVNGCLKEREMVYSICKVYLKWLKRKFVDRLMVCAVKHIKHYAEPSSDVNHHEFHCFNATFDLTSKNVESKNDFFEMCNRTGHLDLTVFLLKVFICSSNSFMDVTQATNTHKNSPSI